MKSAVSVLSASTVGTLLVILMLATPSRADTFLKCVDPATGHTTYTNQSPPKGAQCSRTDGSPVSVISSGNKNGKAQNVKVSSTANLSSGTSAASVDAGTQKTRDGTRRQVLADELTSEEKLLNDARSNFNNGKPLPMADEGVGSPKYIDRVKQLEKTVRLHERNVASLKQELANLKL
jgi:Domain of unknown function (DUF4124)